jgi:hypothetical protein
MEMLRPEDIDKIRSEDHRRLEKINKVADEIAKSKVTVIQEKTQSLKQKIQELIDKKGDLFRSPRSKAETLALAKNILKTQKENFFKDILVNHLRNFQIQRDDFLSPVTLRVNLFTENNAYRFVYWMLSEEDIEKAAQMLPDIGLSEKERELEIQKLDSEISALEDQIEKELRKV